MSDDTQPNNLDAIMQLFRKALPEKIADIEQHWQALQQDSSSAAMQALCESCHSLAGTAATFGYEDIGEQSRHIETTLRPRLDNGDSLSAEDMSAIARHMHSLRSLLDSL